MRAPAVSIDAGAAVALVGLLAVGAVLAWKLAGTNEKGDSGARRAGVAVGEAAGEAATGVVLGVGDSVGLPRTDEDACRAALARGDLWEASFVCPAGEFLSGAYRTVIDADNPQLPSINTGGATGSW